MTKFKAANLFDFYAPPGGGSKIADFGIAFKNAVSANAASPSSATNINAGSSPNGSSASTSSNAGGVGAVPVSPINNPGNGQKPDNTLVYVLLGVVVIGGALYLWHLHKNKSPNYTSNRKPEEKKGDTNRS